MRTPTLVACLECDLLNRPASLPPGGEARCRRCNAPLYRQGRDGANERALALTLAASILFVLANAFPIVGLQLQGVHTSSTLFGAVESLWDDGAEAVAALVFVTTILVPAAELTGLTWVLVALRRGAQRGAVPMLHFIESVKPWGMVEVFVLGVLVSLVKLSHVATVEPGIALFSFGALMLLIAGAAAAFDADAAWAQLSEAR